MPGPIGFLRPITRKEACERRHLRASLTNWTLQNLNSTPIQIQCQEQNERYLLGMEPALIPLQEVGHPLCASTFQTW